MLRIQASKAREDFSRGPTFLFGGGQLPDFEELLASLPAKNVTDKIVSRYFNDYDPAIRELLHAVSCILLTLLQIYYIHHHGKER